MEEFHEKYGLFGAGLQTEKELEENKNCAIHFMDELPEYKEISDKYSAEDKRLEEYRNQCKDEAFELLKEYFFSLWD